MDTSNYRYLVKLGPANVRSWRKAVALVAPKYVGLWSAVSTVVFALCWLTFALLGRSESIFSNSAVRTLLMILWGLLVIAVIRSAYVNAFYWYGLNEDGLVRISSRSKTVKLIPYERIYNFRAIEDRYLAVYYKGSQDSILRNFTSVVFITLEAPEQRRDCEAYLSGKVANSQSGDGVFGDR